MPINDAPTSPQGARPERELIPSDGPLAPFVSVNPERMHGEPCFKGTRVPIQTLFDHLEVDGGLAQFLRGFPDVSRDMAVAAIGLAAGSWLNELRQLSGARFRDITPVRADGTPISEMLIRDRK